MKYPDYRDPDGDWIDNSDEEVDEFENKTGEEFSIEYHYI